jgi:hypothetical protein
MLPQQKAYSYYFTPPLSDPKNLSHLSEVRFIFKSQMQIKRSRLTKNYLKGDRFLL